MPLTSSTPKQLSSALPYSNWPYILFDTIALFNQALPYQKNNNRYLIKRKIPLAIQV